MEESELMFVGKEAIFMTSNSGCHSLISQEVSFAYNQVCKISNGKGKMFNFACTSVILHGGNQTILETPFEEFNEKYNNYLIKNKY